MKLGISDFKVGEKRIKFKTPLLLEPSVVPGAEVMCVFYKDLDLSACDTTLLGCDEIIREELEVLWEEYVEAPDDELTEGGINLKRKLIGMVGRVTYHTNEEEYD